VVIFGSQKGSVSKNVWETFGKECHCGLQPKTLVKPEAAITVFELLMMGDVSPETC
jgi:hypothetical protein